MSVVTEDDLAHRPARTTPEALAEQEGVFLQKTNHGGGAPIIRGLYGQQILLLEDGVRLNNATVRSGPNQFLNTVDLFVIEQLEVVRGPGSVLYGSDALGGVINVLSFWPRFSEEAKPIGLLRGQYGSGDSSLQGHARAGISFANDAVVAAVTGRDFNDLRGGSLVGLQQYTGYEEKDATLKLRHRFDSRTQVYLQYQGVRQTNAPRLDRSLPGDFRRFTEQNRDFIHGWLQRTGGELLSRLKIELSAQRQGDITDRWRISRDLFERDAVDEWTYGLRVEGEARPTLGALGKHSLIVGAESFYDRTTNSFNRSPISTPNTFTPRPQDLRYAGVPKALSTGVFAFLASNERESFSYHAGLRGQFNRATLPEDARLNLTFATSASPPPVFPEANANAFGFAADVGVQQRIAPWFSVLANLGSGFRAPNVDDYLRLGPEGPGFLVPTRDLKPEQSYTSEVGLRVVNERVKAQAFYAFTTIPGLVGNTPTVVDGQPRSPDNLPYLVKQNRDSAKFHSVEAAFTVKALPKLTLAAHASYTYAQQRRKDLTQPGEPEITEPLSRIPPLNGLVRAIYEYSELLFFEAAGRWALQQTRLSAADRLDNRICPEAPDCRGTPGYFAVHLRAGTRLSKHFSAAITLQNLFDTTYRNHGSGVDEPGRSVVVGVEGSL
jgi:outer membrane receptor protein involved in Fe transport